MSSSLKILEGGRRSSAQSSRVTSGAIVRLAVEHSQGRAPSLKDVLGFDATPRRA